MLRFCAVRGTRYSVRRTSLIKPMLTNLRKNFNFPSKKSIKSIMGFSVLEILIVLTIIAIMFGAMVAMKSPFQERLSLRNSALALQQDLRNAQLYAWNKRDGRQFYGVRFFEAQGADLLPPGEPARQGWKIVYYNEAIAPVNFITAVVVKSSVAADNPELLDKTFFTSNRISLDAASDFQTTFPAVAPWLHSIVFNRDGQATSDGTTLLVSGVGPGADQDQIILTGSGNTITITITPQTGHIEVPFP